MVRVKFWSCELLVGLGAAYIQYVLELHAHHNSTQ